MGRRTNTAVWLDKYKRWKIKVQKDGERRMFSSSTPGRNGQRESNRKAGEWLDDGISSVNHKIRDYFEQYIYYLKQLTSRSNWSNGVPEGVRKIIQPDDLAKLMSSDMTTYRGKPAKDNLVNAYHLVEAILPRQRHTGNHVVRTMDTFGVYGHEFAGVKEEIANQADSIFGSLLGIEKTMG